MNQEFEQNPYATPASQLQQNPTGAGAPSIEEALARGYDFRIGDVLGEAWHKVKGMKGTLVVAAIIYAVAVNLLSFVIAFVLGLLGLIHDSEPGALQIIVSVLAGALCYPLLAGLNMIGIRRAADQPATINELFAYFGLFVPLLVTGLAITVLTYLGLFLLVLPGIYLGVSYALAIPLVVERGLSPWQAMEASRKAIGQHWFKVFGLFLALGLIMLLSAIPLLIGLVWTLPLAFIAIGVLYRTIFGVLPPAN
ncbi:MULTISPECIES: hypothetical protein [unclassified Pseudomonas]|jgi:uncharacterized membrane protein|uniref:hypothetical protein n=1 Tax=unclassified Pseudomonas TaxID=196821 RepID=UPI000730F738|nr:MULTISPECIES: hypothetical protein [unclassified Pseudomonas]KSW24285.1 hypothetical protein AOX63_11120 [Pseudomonas sp. ADP]OBP13045.1 hypothetical protein BAE52_01465 [Pseudomonas sp. EGD-AKN5]QOF86840.1 hypothetical protein IG194_09235 [Pseudomonas sp. ADPe]